MKLNLKNKEIQKWLESRDWLHHYEGNGEGFYARFSSLKFENIKQKGLIRCKETSFPLYDENKTYCTNTWVHLGKELMGTYSSPKVHLSICSQNTSREEEFPYSLEIHFSFTGDNEYSTVFFGYIINVEELKQVFNLLGLEPKYWI